MISTVTIIVGMARRHRMVGRRITKVTERRTKSDWANFLNEIAECYAQAEKITLVMDNLNTHRPGALYEAYPPKQAKALWDRFEFVHTSKHSSWLNVAEVEINVMVRQCLNRRIQSMEIMSQDVVIVTSDKVQSLPQYRRKKWSACLRR